MLRRLAIAGLVLGSLGSPAAAESGLLDETVSFTGAVLFISSGVPGLVIAAVQDGERAVAGFGTTADKDGREPDGETLLRIGSITKVMTGLTLAQLAAEGRVALTDPVSEHLDWQVTWPTREGRGMRLLDLATHAGGLPREMEVPPGPPDDPNANHDEAAFVSFLNGDPLIYPPGGGILYSNVGFDILAQALGQAAGKPFDQVLEEKVLAPVGLKATGFDVPAEKRGNLMQGHDWHGKAMPEIRSAPGVYGSGALYSTANDMLTWLEWNLDRFGEEAAEARSLSHAAYLWRDGIRPVYGMDESGHMDAMGLGWVIMQPEGDRPLILQKAGGAQGIFSYAAFAPTRNVGVFVAINAYDFDTAMKMAEVANELIATLAPR